MKLLRYCLLVFILLDGCIDPLAIETKDSKLLVVDGMITDQPGPYTVLLSYSNKVGDEIYVTDKVSGAVVQIVSDAGDAEQLKELKPGVFVTQTIQGVVGVTYTLKISFHEFTYESLPEKIIPVGDFGDLYYEFEKVENPVATDYLHTKNGFKLLTNSQVLPEQEGRVRWRWRGTYEMLTYPQFRLKAVTSRTGVISYVPDPPLCSLHYSCGCCTCCTCWVSTYNNEINLSNLKLNGLEHISGQYVGFVPATRRLFYTKYKIEVDQMSLSRNIYDYWKRIEVQNVAGSDLFQTPPPNTIGNIISTSADSPQALGIFSASAIKTRELTLMREDVPYALPPVDTVAESCLAAFKNSSTVRPPNW